MYENHYRAFSENITFAARILHYYLRMGFHAQENSEELKAINQSPRFWLDWNFMALQTVIIFLGKIFDGQSRTHNLTALLEALPNSMSHFSKEELRKRKIKAGLTDLEILDTYIADAHELDASDIIAINEQAEEAKKIWKKIYPLRNRFYAHHQMLTNEERDKLFRRVTYDELELIVQILLNISFALEQAEINGRKPDFDTDYEGPINRAEGEVDRMIQTLAGLNSESV
jgi:hypothetical protein